MKKHSHISLSGLLFLLPLWSAGQVFHTDPNTNNVQVAAAVDKGNSVSGIVLSNTSSSDLSIQLSDDKTNWNPVKIPKQTALSFQTSPKYVKIYTTATVFSYFKLTSGYTYTIFWDNDNSKWSIK